MEYYPIFRLVMLHLKKVPRYYSPVRHVTLTGTFDLHVLGTPPAFILSQDQTLQKIADLLKSGRMTGQKDPNPEFSSCSDLNWRDVLLL